jgi:ribosomal protein S18 acetylase RimI-like enzyme
VRIELRSASLDDVPSLAPLWKAMVEHHGHLVGDRWPVLAPEEAWSRRREQYVAWLTDETGFILIAEGDGADRPVGYLACRLLQAGPTFDLGDVRGDVDSLVTAEAARGHGVGSALLEGCRAELRRRGVRYCSIGVVEANTRAIELYERLGFQPFVRSMLARIDESS